MTKRKILGLIKQYKEIGEHPLTFRSFLVFAGILPADLDGFDDDVLRVLDLFRFELDALLERELLSQTKGKGYDYKTALTIYTQQTTPSKTGLGSVANPTKRLQMKNVSGFSFDDGEKS